MRPDRPMAALRRILVPGERANRVLLLGLGLLAFAASLTTLADLIRVFPRSVDLEIPLRAAARWLAGGQAYLPSAFTHPSGYELPFLYPPYALPLFAPLTWLPRDPLHAAWFAGGVAVAWATCRRLGFQHRWIPFVLAWPPFAEGLISGNIQIATVAAFVFLLVPRTGPTAPAEASAGDGSRRSLATRGLLGAATVFLKVSQGHAVLYLLRREWRAAVIAGGVIGLLVVLTLPLTGIGIWGDWLAQIRRASDPAWTVAGPSLNRYLPVPIPTLLIVAGFVAAFLAPRRGAAAWVGLVLLLGSSSIHAYYLLFLLPAMLRIRWELGLVAAFLIGFQVELGWWSALAVVAATMVLSLRFPQLLQPPATAMAAVELGGDDTG